MHPSRQIGRCLEIFRARFNREAILEVYQSDADLTLKKLVWQGFHKDIAETKMALLFRSSGYEIDFLLYNRSTMENDLLMLSNKTIQRRNECLG